ncbi:MAG: 50S ribosomal protein L21 [Candidatus Dormibacteria bacterium]
MTYAIIAEGGHQYRVHEGDRLLVNRLEASVGQSVTLGEVLFLVEESKGSSTLVQEGSVEATVVAHRRGKKLRVFTYKAKKRERRTLGFRSDLTEVEIAKIHKSRADHAPKGHKEAASATESAAKALARAHTPRKTVALDDSEGKGE